MKKTHFLIKSVKGGFKIIGQIGERLYYYHTKLEAIDKYLMEARTNECNKYNR